MPIGVLSSYLNNMGTRNCEKSGKSGESRINDSRGARRIDESTSRRTTHSAERQIQSAKKQGTGPR